MSDTTAPVEKTVAQTSEKGAINANKSADPGAWITPELRPHVDDLMDKVRATERKALAEKDAEIEKLKRSQMSEKDKAIADARDEGAKEWKAKWEERDRDDAHRKTYREGGINLKREDDALLIIKAKQPKADPSEALSFLKREYPEFFGNGKSFGPGDGVTHHSAQPSDWSRDEIEKALEGMTPEQRVHWWKKNGEAVTEYQRRQSPFRTVPPGVPMFGK